jgi:hypothetical protein
MAKSSAIVTRMSARARVIGNAMVAKPKEMPPIDSVDWENVWQ